MSAQNTMAKIKEDVLDDASAKELGRAFLRPEGIKRLVVASPGNISVECGLNHQKPKGEAETNKESRLPR